MATGYTSDDELLAQLRRDEGRLFDAYNGGDGAAGDPLLVTHTKTGRRYIIPGCCLDEASKQTLVRYRQIGSELEWTRPIEAVLERFRSGGRDGE